MADVNCTAISSI